MNKKNHHRTAFAAAFITLALLSAGLPAAAAPALSHPAEPIALATMGSFAFGGTVSQNANGVTFHGDHGYAQYYIAAHSRTLPIVMWHGIGQSGKTYESTPDGREGYQAILPRRDWSVYIVDQPRRGRAGRSDAPQVKSEVPTVLYENAVWDAFRNGPWNPPERPVLHAGSQFPFSGYALDQFFRQQTPDTAEEPNTAEYREFMGRTGKALFDRIGDGILMTHSNSGQYGWAIGMEAPERVKAIVAYEPGAFAFPAEEMPEPIASAHPLVAERLAPQPVPMEKWLRLTKMPIVIYYGDNIAQEPSKIFNEEVWRTALARAKQFAEAINRHGGDAQVVEFPKLGIRGNTHAAFADRNNLEIADLLSAFLKEKKLDGYAAPHQGPMAAEMDCVPAIDVR